MDYISRHVRQAYAKEQESKAYQLYVAETLRCMSESVAMFAGGPYMPTKWADIIDPKPEETRTPEQVIDQVMGRLKEVGGAAPAEMEGGGKP